MERSTQKLTEKAIWFSKVDPEGQEIYLAGLVQNLATMVKADMIGSLILLLGVPIEISFNHILCETSWMDLVSIAVN